MLKKILTFLFFFLPWYLGTILFPVNLNYYHSLNLPFHLPPFVFMVIWTMIYLCVAYVSMVLYVTYGTKETKGYFRSLCFNYTLNTLFLYFLFSLKSLFLGFTNSVILFISTLLCFYEAREIEHALKYYFVPYLFLTLSSIFFLLCSIFMNL